MKRIKDFLGLSQHQQCTTLTIVTIQGMQIPLEIRKTTKAKYYRISYRHGQPIRITVARGISNKGIHELIQSKGQWILDHYHKKSDSWIESNPDLLNYSTEHFVTHKESALIFCQQKVIQRNQQLGRNYNKITVKPLRSKWGSCSNRGNLNFNYKIIFVPEAMADYIIVHELCHLREMNHGPRFWKLVEEVYGPEWKQRRQIR